MADSFQMKFATAVIVLVLGLQFLAVVTRSGKWAWPFIDYPMYSTSHQEGERVPARHVIYGITSDGAKIELTMQAIGVNLWMHEKWARDLKNLDLAAVISAAAATVTALPAAAMSAAVSPVAAKPGAAPPTEPAARRPWSIKHWLRSTTLFKTFKGKDDPELTPLFLDLFAKKNGVKIVELQIEDRSVVVTREGVGAAPREVVSIALDPRH